MDGGMNNIQTLEQKTDTTVDGFAASLYVHNQPIPFPFSN